MKPSGPDIWLKTICPTVYVTLPPVPVAVPPAAVMASCPEMAGKDTLQIIRIYAAFLINAFMVI
jgi:hypothetical protein